MFFVEAQIRVHLYGQPTDMRKSYDGLQALARHAMGHDPLDGALYLFINRRGSQLKCLYFDRSGFCIWGKRLESSKFVSDWRAVPAVPDQLNPRWIECEGAGAECSVGSWRSCTWAAHAE